MNGLRLRDLKERYRFEEWRDQTTLPENLFIWQYQLSGEVLPGWRPEPVRTLASPPAAAATGTEEEAALRLIQGIWRPGAGRQSKAVSIDIYECGSRLEAREVLVRVLGQFQSPQLKQAPELVGDVNFAPPGDRIVLFARANQVIVLRSLGQVLVPITELAQKFDQELIAKPPVEAVRMAPVFRRAEAAEPELAIGRRTQLQLQAEHPADGPLTYKIYATGGEVVAREGELFYEARQGGEQTVEVYALTFQRAAARRTVQFNVRNEE